MTQNKRTENGNSYRSILKGTSIFGGVQLFHILVSLARGKLVAMFLGPAGMGISAMYLSSTQAVQQFASMGLNMAIVREVACSAEHTEILSRVVRAVRRLILLTALLGAITCLILSRWLSQTSFGNADHTLAFAVLGVAVFFNIAGNGEMSVLQGIHDVKRLSKATIIGSLCGITVSVPLYYFYGSNGIVPAMIVLAFVLYLFYAISTRQQIRQSNNAFIWKEHFPLMKKMLLMGLLLMSGELIGSLCTYLTQAFVRWAGDIKDVGLFQGANSLTMQYSGLVFAAMAMDYLPRLSNSTSDNKAMTEIINKQTEIVGYLIGPMASALILFAPLIVKILLTPDFNDTIPLIRLLGCSLAIRALMTPMAYVTFVKDNKKVYFWLEAIGGNVVILAFSIIGYKLFGLIGLGYGCLADKILWFPVYYLVNRQLYSCRISNAATKGIVYAIIMVSAVWATSVFENTIGLIGEFTIMGIIFFSGTGIAFFKLKRLLSK